MVKENYVDGDTVNDDSMNEFGHAINQVVAANADDDAAIAAKANPDGSYGPAQYGLDAWTYDPAMSFQGTGAHGYLWCTSLIATKPQIGRIVLGLWGVGAGTPTNNFVALFDKNGVRKALVDTGNSWYTGTQGRREHTFTPVDVTVGDPYTIGILSNSSGATPAFVNSIGAFTYGGAYIMKTGVAGTPIRHGIYSSLLTAIPTSFDPTTVGGNQQLFAGVKDS